MLQTGTLRFRRSAFVGVFLFFIAASVRSARAENFIVSDSPVTLGGSIWQPWEVVRDDDGTFSLAVAFPAGTAIDGVHRMDGGDWLVSVSEPTLLGGTVYDPRDIVRYDGSNYTLFFNGAAAGIPAEANVDTVFLSGGDAGDLILGFDIPVVLGGTTYGPSDLARFQAGTFSKLFDASASSPPIPATTNLLDADEIGGKLYFSFDVPTTLGSSTFLPGDVVSWNGIRFALRFRTSGWPPGSAMTGLGIRVGGCLDWDGDTFGDPGHAACPGGLATDCDDVNPATFPGGPQLCDGINNDCNDPTWPDSPPDEFDADGDGFRLCSGECDDGASNVYPGASQICGDGLNNDCNHPNWPALGGTNEGDDDADNLTECAGDCTDANATVWGTPGEVLGLAITGGGTLTWSPPSALGGTPASMLYDTIRSTIRNDFVTSPPATCVESDDGPNTTAMDATVPPVGTVFYYLIRAQNACPGALGMGPLGTTSSGTPRSARDCP